MVLLHRLKWLGVIAASFFVAAWMLTQVALWKGDDGARGRRKCDGVWRLGTRSW